jgi:hypothetical protein
MFEVEPSLIGFSEGVSVILRGTAVNRLVSAASGAGGWPVGP